MEQTILIIEDDLNLRTGTAELLSLSGYNVLTAENGKTGLELAKSKYPDLILCDILMPELDGYGVLRALENIPELAGTPLVYLSAKTELSDFRYAMDLGADDYLPKPFTADNLLKVIAARIKKNKTVKLNSANVMALDSILNDTKTIQEIATMSNNRQIFKIKNKEIVFKEGSSPSYLYFIVSGKVKIIRANETGKEYIIQLKNQGDCFGYTALIHESSYKESAVAIEDTELALIPKNDFFQLLYSKNDICLKFTKIINTNLIDTEERLIKMAFDSGRKKTAEALLFFYKTFTPPDKDGYFYLQRENLAALAGLSPETVSRNLSDFKEEGLIECSSRDIRIVSIKKLAALKN